VVNLTFPECDLDAHELGGQGNPPQFENSGESQKTNKKLLKIEDGP
jgi:hypothetical protein